jgi:hypothetical protein
VRLAPDVLANAVVDRLMLGKHWAENAALTFAVGHEERSEIKLRLKEGPQRRRIHF